MGLVEIPGYEQIDLPVLQMGEAVLPADYPLFDWADWPESRAALVPGGPTARFEKACWNAIITAISQAANDAGFVRQNLYTGYMPDWELGWLTAEKMNNLVEAFDRFLPMPWFWRSDRFGTFEKSVFYGRPSWGVGDRQADVLYPEYILGLADRVNLYIQLMRGNYPYTLTGGAAHSVLLRIQAGLKVGGQARIDVQQISRIQLPETPAQLGRSLPFDRQVIARTAVAELPVIAHRGGTIYIPDHTAASQIRIRGRSRPGSLPDIVPVISRLSVRMEEILLTRGFREGEAKQQSFSGLAVSAAGGSGATAGVELLSRICAEINMISRLSLPAGTTHKAHTVLLPALDARRSLLTDVQQQSKVLRSLTVLRREGLLTWVEKRATTGISILARSERSALLEPDPVQSRLNVRLEDIALSRGSLEAQAQCQSVSTQKAEAIGRSGYKVWAEQISGTLCEGRTHSVLSAATEAEHTSRTIAAPDAVFGEALKTEVKETAKISHSMSILTPPVSFLQAEEPSHSQTLVTPAGKQAGVVRPSQASRSSVVCSLGTAWLPPVWIDGGLYIRQAYSAVQREDGSLEVH